MPLARFTEDTGAELVADAVVGVDDAAARGAACAPAATLAFDALLLAPGGRRSPASRAPRPGGPVGDSDIYGGLLRDIEEGYAKRLAIVVPPGAVWPLPAYELALMTAGEARAMGHDDVCVTVVTPERAPLSLFGDQASAAVAEELEPPASACGPASWPRRPGGPRAGAGRRAARRPARVRRPAHSSGPRSQGLPADDEGFILAGRRRAA